MKLDRRELLKVSLLAAGAGELAGAAEPPGDSRSEEDAAPATPVPQRPWETIDTNVHLFQWPFRRLPFDGPGELSEKLRSMSIKQAWVGSFEALLHRDLSEVNARLAKACREAPKGLLVPLGSVNPTLPDWEEDLRRCHETFRMPGIRLYPNYHDYTLSDPRLQQLWEVAAGRGLRIQVSVAMEDRRTQHAMLQVPDTDLSPLPDLLKKNPRAKVMLLNYRPSGAVFDALATISSISFDIARVEATDGIARLIRSVSAERVLFGSHAPLLIMEAALIKVYESDLSETEIRHLLHQNAADMLVA